MCCRTQLTQELVLLANRFYGLAWQGRRTTEITGCGPHRNKSAPVLLLLLLLAATHCCWSVSERKLSGRGDSGRADKRAALLIQSSCVGTIEKLIAATNQTRASAALGRSSARRARWLSVTISWLVLVARFVVVVVAAAARGGKQLGGRDVQQQPSSKLRSGPAREAILASEPSDAAHAFTGRLSWLHAKPSTNSTGRPHILVSRLVPACKYLSDHVWLVLRQGFSLGLASRRNNKTNNRLASSAVV